MPVLVPATSKSEALPLNGILCKSGWFLSTHKLLLNQSPGCSQDIFG